MHAQAPAAPATRAGDHDVRHDAVRRPDFLERRGRPVAQARAGSARQNGREPLALAPDDGMADGVDAAVEAVEPSALNAASDRALGQTEVAELVARDDAELLGGELRYGAIGRHSRAPRRSSLAHAPEDERRRVACDGATAPTLR